MREVLTVYMVCGWDILPLVLEATMWPRCYNYHPRATSQTLSRASHWLGPWVRKCLTLYRPLMVALLNLHANVKDVWTVEGAPLVL